MLSAIYIKGFKTFARPVRMPLTGGVTAVVGPNGSGKSNITDAVLFALGEGSPSLLRAGAMSELIFSGSETLAAANVAEVTLVLDNSEGGISLPYTEVSLTRRISRTGETQYRINGSGARLQDVRAVAGEAGLGRHSILRQGAVDAIVSGGPAACRIALEEAAGLGVYRRRRATAARRLESAASQLESARSLEGELAAQLKRIQFEAAAAREYRELEARYRDLSLTHLYRSATEGFSGHEERLEALERRIVEYAAEETALREEGAALEEEERAHSRRLREIEDLLARLETAAEAVRAGSLRAERTMVRAEGARERDDRRAKLHSRLRAEHARLEAALPDLEREVPRLESEHARRKAGLREREGTVSRGREKHGEAARRRAKLVGRMEALRGRREAAGELLGGQGASVSDGVSERLKGIGEDDLYGRIAGLRGRAMELRVQGVGLRRAVDGAAAEANRRRGGLAALVGRAEAEVRASRSRVEKPPKDGSVDSSGRRLREVVRARPGYEAAVDAALGDLAGGVLSENLREGLGLITGPNPPERVVVRLDAEGVPRGHEAPSCARPLVECVEVLDARYAAPVERLLDGHFLLEGDAEAPNNGYVVVTHDGLRLTRTSASRPSPEGDFALLGHLRDATERLEALEGGIQGDLHELRDTVSSAGDRVGKLREQTDLLADLTDRVARSAARIPVEVSRRVERIQAAGERRSGAEEDLRRVEAELAAVALKLRESEEAESEARDELDAASRAVGPAYDAARSAAGAAAAARRTATEARDRRTALARELAKLEATGTRGAAVSPGLVRRVSGAAERLDKFLRHRLADLRGERSRAAEDKDRVLARLGALSREGGKLAGEHARATHEVATLRVELQRISASARAAEAEISEEWGATVESARETALTLLGTGDPTTRAGELEKERARLARRLKGFGDVNLLAIGQETAIRERHDLVAAQRHDAEQAAADISRIIQDVDGEVEERFGRVFGGVKKAFEGLVPRMIGGAVGSLELSEEGVEIGLRLPRRGWRSLRVLSGGERSLLALAFLFGVFLGRREMEGGGGTFCMLDEAEAALDDVNLARFLSVVDSHRADGQFVLVTHQKRTMAAADVLYGVTQEASGATVVVSKRLTGG